MYNKLFTKILDSSIWLEAHPTRIVWLTLLAAMDEDGYAHFAAIGNLASRARVTAEECVEAVRILSSPDAESGNQDHGGRRIERVPGGWMVLNAKAHRDLITREIAKAQTRNRVQRHRDAKRNGVVTPRNAPVTLRNDSETPSEAVSEAETEAKSSSLSPSRRAKGQALVWQDDLFNAFWSAYPRKTGKGDAVKAWKKIPTVTERLLDQMLKTLGWQVTSDQWTKDGGQFIPHPATWLNQRRWEDEPVSVVAVATRPKNKFDESIAAGQRTLARMKAKGTLD